MKIAKRLCPVCHNIVKVSHVDTVGGIKLRRCQCNVCGASIRFMQRPGEDEVLYRLVVKKKSFEEDFIMKNFAYYYGLYEAGDERLYDMLTMDIIKYLEQECDKSAKYYDFKCFLMDAELYYKEV